eukprot:jgi/Mesvir1/3577/Mv12040-RA.1
MNSPEDMPDALTKDNMSIPVPGMLVPLRRWIQSVGALALAWNKWKTQGLLSLAALIIICLLLFGSGKHPTFPPYEAPKLSHVPVVHQELTVDLRRKATPVNGPPVGIQAVSGHEPQSYTPVSMRSPEFVYGGTWGITQKAARLTDDAPTQSAHATTLLTMAGGAILCAWFGGTYEGFEDVGIYVATGHVRPNGHSTWSTPILAAKVHRNVPYNGKGLPNEPKKEGGEPHWNPVVFCGDRGRGVTANGECTGEILLFFKLGWKIHEWETWVTRSHDQGQTWSTPQELVRGDKGGRGPVKNKPILLSDGSWLAPGSLEAGLKNPKEKFWRSFVDRSEDFGKTWVKSPEIFRDPKSGNIQPTLWEQPPGHVHMMMRSSKGKTARIWRADSHDGGRTWSQPARTSLPNNNSGLDVVLLPRSGTLVLAYNHNTEERFPLRLAISEDNGATWKRAYDVETEHGHVHAPKPGIPGHEFSYPAIISWPDTAAEDGFYLSYTWHRRRVAFLSMSLADLKHASFAM